MKGRKWRLINDVVGIVTIILSLIMLIRPIDGTGHVETWGSRLLALGVLAIFVLLLAGVESLIRRVMRH